MQVAVVGAGVMGPGIAQVFLMGGHQVALSDIRTEALQAAQAQIGASLGLMAQQGIAVDPGCGERLTTTTDLAQAVSGAELVVEAVPERLDIKQALYAQLDPLCDPGALVVSNTSAFPLPDLMPDFRPDSFFVAHFLNPAQIIPLVELVTNQRTDPARVRWLRAVLEDCGKQPIHLTRFVPGFLVNRLQTALAREALALLGQGVVSQADLNTATVVGIGFKTAWQGFFDTMDEIGLDTVAAVYQLLYPQLSNDTQVPRVLTDKVAQGQLGVKTGQGFLRHDDPEMAQRQRLTVLLEQLALYNRYQRPRRDQP